MRACERVPADAGDVPLVLAVESDADIFDTATRREPLKIHAMRQWLFEDGEKVPLGAWCGEEWWC